MIHLRSFSLRQPESLFAQGHGFSIVFNKNRVIEKVGKLNGSRLIITQVSVADTSMQIV